MNVYRLFMTANRKREPSGKSSSAARSSSHRVARSPKEGLPTLVTHSTRLEESRSAVRRCGLCKLAEISDLRVQAKSLRIRFSRS